MRVSAFQINWIAGLLEGEGSFGFTPRNNATTIRLLMTDRDVVQKAADILGTNVYGPYQHSGNRKKTWQLALCGNKSIQWMMTLYKLMGSRRKAKIAEIIEAWKIGLNPRRAVCHSRRRLASRGLCQPCLDDVRGVTEAQRTRKRKSANRRYHLRPPEENSRINREQHLRRKAIRGAEATAI